MPSTVTVPKGNDLEVTDSLKMKVTNSKTKKKENQKKIQNEIKPNNDNSSATEHHSGVADIKRDNKETNVKLQQDSVNASSVEVSEESGKKEIFKLFFKKKMGRLGIFNSQAMLRKIEVINFLNSL